MTAPPYDTTPYIVPVPRLGDFHLANAKITWLPYDGGEGLTVIGAYLDARSPDCAVALGCGIEEALADLGLGDLGQRHMVLICNAVTDQLAEQPTATVTCPAGTAIVELVEVPG